VVRGEQALRRYHADWIETFDTLHAEVEEVCPVRDGLMVGREYETEAEALAAVGSSP
jgi:hypothetical protein